MHQWYWSHHYQNPDFFNSENESILFASLPSDQNIAESSTVTIDSLSQPVPTGLLDSIHAKLKLQLDYNKSVASRSFRVYSPNFPAEMQLENSEISHLHKHLSQLDEGYDLRLSKKEGVGFRMFRSTTSAYAIQSSEELLRHVNKR